MKVLYYTVTHQMDVSLEIIKVLKNYVNLHVVIEICPTNKTSNIIDIKQLPEDVLIRPDKLLSERDYKILEPFIKGVDDIFFIVHKNKQLYSSIKASYALWKYVKKIKPDVVHMENLTTRSLGIIPSLIFTKRLFLAIHDPIRHTGEKTWRSNFIIAMFMNYPIQKGYFFYSAFSKSIFEKQFKKNKYKKWMIKMRPFTYYKNLENNEEKDRKHILFFGRLSPYKGIDTLLKAMPLVFQKYPDELLIIAGRSIEGYTLNAEIEDTFKHKVKVINKYISNSELYKMILEAKFIVCPYKDATQSGVLMTAFALNTPVVATNVGAFPEFIEDNVTSLLAPANDHETLSERIIQALNKDFYKQMGKQISLQNETNKWDLNRNILLEAYTS